MNFNRCYATIVRNATRKSQRGIHVLSATTTTSTRIKGMHCRGLWAHPIRCRFRVEQWRSHAIARVSALILENRVEWTNPRKADSASRALFGSRLATERIIARLCPDGSLKRPWIPSGLSPNHKVQLASHPL